MLNIFKMLCLHHHQLIVYYQIFFRINLFFFFSLGIKEKLEEKRNEIKLLGHNIRMGIKRKK